MKKVTLYLKSSQPWTIFNHNMKSIWTIFVVDKKLQSAGVAMSSVTSHAGLIVVKDAFPPLHLVLLGDNWGDGQGDVATDVPGQGDIPGCRLWTSHHWASNVPGASLHEVCTFRMSQPAVRPYRVIEWLIWTPWAETLREAPFWNVVPVFGLRPFGEEGGGNACPDGLLFFPHPNGQFLVSKGVRTRTTFQTLPKAQETRVLSWYLKITVHSSQILTYYNFRISIKH